MDAATYTVPGLDKQDAAAVVDVLDDRMVSLIDLSLTLKHVHWNVVGPNFIAVHEMLDPQVESIRLMSDALAERIAALGGVPVGTPGALVERRSWRDYQLGKATVAAHLSELDQVFTGIIEDHRKAQSRLSDLDAVSEGMLIDQLAELEQFQWFVRAHGENAEGSVG